MENPEKKSFRIALLLVNESKVGCCGAVGVQLQIGLIYKLVLKTELDCWSYTPFGVTKFQINFEKPLFL